MNTVRFDLVAKHLADAGTRRGILCRIAAITLPLVGALPGLGETGEAARRRHQMTQRRTDRQDRTHDKKKKKKKTCAKAGQPTSKKRKKCCFGLSKDATGHCAAQSSGCTPASCGPTSCGSVPDGCGGTLSCGGCAGNSLCHGDACQPCAVTCLSGNPEICGVDLQAALDEGGTVYVCPGRYQGGFVLNDAVAIIGAGEGATVAANTILHANNLGRVLLINGGVGTVELERLRITGGNTTSNFGSANGAGILHNGTMLRMTECAVSDNTTLHNNGSGILTNGTLEMTRCTVRANHSTGIAAGVGIATTGTTTLTDCLVEENTGGSAGVGMYVPSGTTTLAGNTQVRGNHLESSFTAAGGGINVGGGTLIVAETCRVTQNTATEGQGGGIFRSGGTVTLQGPTPSPIVVDNCHENCVGTVTKCALTPVSC